MIEKACTIKELHNILTDMIDNGREDDEIQLSVNYDKCDHVQKLNKVFITDYDWIVLIGGHYE